MTPEIEVKTVIDRTKEVEKNIKTLMGSQLLVGVPSANAGRWAGKEGQPVGNAEIGYIQEFGSPRANIPARPFLVPGIQAALPLILKRLQAAGASALAGQKGNAERSLHAAGLIAQNSVRRRISSNIPPPLAARTVYGRLHRTQAGQRRLKGIKNAGIALKAWGAANLTTLVDTAQLRSSITYVIEKK